MNDRPSGAMARPSSSVGPEVICSGGVERIARRETLAPRVKGVAGVRAEIHPCAVGRPAGKPAVRVRRADVAAGRTCVHRNQTARRPGAAVGHFRHQRPTAIGRRIRPMRHRALRHRHIQIARVGAALIGRHDLHMVAFAASDLLGEQQLLPARPDQPRCIRQPSPRLAAENRDHPRVPFVVRVRRGVSDSRAIRRKHGTHLRHGVVGQLLRLAIGQHLHVHLTGCRERVRPTNEGQHAPIRRERRLAD